MLQHADAGVSFSELSTVLQAKGLPKHWGEAELRRLFEEFTISQNQVEGVQVLIEEPADGDLRYRMTLVDTSADSEAFINWLESEEQDRRNEVAEVPRPRLLSRKLFEQGLTALFNSPEASVSIRTFSEIEEQLLDALKRWHLETFVAFMNQMLAESPFFELKVSADENHTVSLKPKENPVQVFSNEDHEVFSLFMTRRINPLNQKLRQDPLAVDEARRTKLEKKTPWVDYTTQKRSRLFWLIFQAYHYEQMMSARMEDTLGLDSEEVAVLRELMEHTQFSSEDETAFDLPQESNFPGINSMELHLLLCSSLDDFKVICEL